MGGHQSIEYPSFRQRLGLASPKVSELLLKRIMTNFQKYLNIFVSQILYSVLAKTVRGSFLLMGGILLISGTSAWKFADSNFSAHDFTRAAHYMAGQSSAVVTIGIDDTAYSEYFGGRSPLDRTKLLSLLQAIQSAAPQAKKIVIDLDLAPVQGDQQNDLFKFLSARKDQWVLAEPIRGIADENEATKGWRHRICEAGMSVGLPYLPTEFGYLNTKQQFAFSLADVAIHPQKQLCKTFRTTIEAQGQADKRQDLQKVTFTMSPSYVKDGLVVPFHGNIEELSSTLALMSPSYIVVGGVWGTGDILQTPFGDRYGAQLHAAAMDGALKHERPLPYVLNFVVVWLVVGSLTIVLANLQHTLFHWVKKGDAALPGHSMLLTKLWPLFVLMLSFTWVILLAEGLAGLFSLTGLQVSSAVAAASVLTYVLFSWNFGLSAIHLQTDIKETLASKFLNPLAADLKSIRCAAGHLLGQKPTTSEVLKLAGFSKMRTILELLLSVASLLLQTLLPLVVLYFSILKSI